MRYDHTVFALRCSLLEQAMEQHVVCDRDQAIYIDLVLSRPVLMDMPGLLLFVCLRKRGAWCVYRILQSCIVCDTLLIKVIPLQREPEQLFRSRGIEGRSTCKALSRNQNSPSRCAAENLSKWRLPPPGKLKNKCRRIYAFTWDSMPWRCYSRS